VASPDDDGIRNDSGRNRPNIRLMNATPPSPDTACSAELRIVSVIWPLVMITVHASRDPDDQGDTPRRSRDAVDEALDEVRLRAARRDPMRIAEQQERRRHLREPPVVGRDPLDAEVGPRTTPMIITIERQEEEPEDRASGAWSSRPPARSGRRGRECESISARSAAMSDRAGSALTRARVAHHHQTTGSRADDSRITSRADQAFVDSQSPAKPGSDTCRERVDRRPEHADAAPEQQDDGRPVSESYPRATIDRDHEDIDARLSSAMPSVVPPSANSAIRIGIIRRSRPAQAFDDTSRSPPGSRPSAS
jgi:hypothetical protein